MIIPAAGRSAVRLDERTQEIAELAAPGLAEPPVRNPWFSLPFRSVSATQKAI